MNKIDPRSPGKSTAGDEFCDPHGHGVGSPSDGGHVGMGRDDSGGFKSMARGGESPDGDAMVAKYRPGRGGGGGSSDEIPSGSSLNEDGDGYD